MCLKIQPAKLPKSAFELGFAHRKLGVKAPNETPLGTVIAAPPAEERELFCRNGLKWFAKIPAKNIRATLKEIEKQRAVLRSAGSDPARASNRSARAGPETGAPLRRTGFGRAHGGAIVPIHAVAAGGGGGKSCGGKTTGANRHPRIARNWRRISTRSGRCATRPRRSIARRFCAGG